MKPAIRVEGLSKRYRIGAAQQDSYRTLRESISAGAAESWRNVRRLAGRRRPDRDPRPGNRRDGEFWALQDVSFEVRPGEVVGIIGRNGAGKSTLLKILSRITEPTSGRAEFRGRIGSLLEVGTGFHPELTGRENIYLNGGILGMSRRDVARRFDEIVEFAEIGEFLDTPVKRYSSGMYVRLAFAVAAHLEPEILIVDEVLAVGDAGFQRKCLGRMSDISGEGRTVLFVTHNMATVTSLCTKAFWLSRGCVHVEGEPRKVVDSYLEENIACASSFIDLGDCPRSQGYASALKITAVEWLTEWPMRHSEPVKLRIYADVLRNVEGVSLGFGFATLEGMRLLSFDSDFHSERFSFRPGDRVHADVEIDRLDLSPGVYTIDVGARSGDLFGLDYVTSAARLEVAPGEGTPDYLRRVTNSGVRCGGRWTTGIAR